VSEEPSVTINISAPLSRFFKYFKIEPKYLFQQSEFNKEVNLLEIFENMNPYITLRILAENPLNNYIV
jgi:hypothetical protein